MILIHSFCSMSKLMRSYTIWSSSNFGLSHNLMDILCVHSILTRVLTLNKRLNMATILIILNKILLKLGRLFKSHAVLLKPTG